MKYIWKMIDETSCKKDVKNNLFMVAMTIISLFTGLLIWFVIRKAVYNADWFYFIVALPIVGVGFFGSVMYLFNHEFK